VATRGGISRLHQGRFFNELVPDPLVLEDIAPLAILLLVNAAGSVSTANSIIISLAETGDGSIWAGALNDGLWRIDGTHPYDAAPRLYGAADGMPNGNIRALFTDAAGTLWIGTLGGGLAQYRDAVSSRYTAADGLLSDNISHIDDDLAGNLWLSTARGICRVAKKQLADFQGWQNPVPNALAG
jgi:ligand-binding sensor domain-containing protein